MRRSLALVSVLMLGVCSLALAEKRLTPKEAKALIEEYKAREAVAKARISELEAQVEALKGEIAELDRKIAELEAQLAELQKLPKYYGRYIVKEGDWLAKIAGYREIYNDPTKWPVIYEHNKDLIKDPNLIYPGWLLFIPGVDVYRVVPTDCLWLIASYISVYGNAREWPKIYEANRDKIRDPDLIYPGQEFQIPRD